MATLEQMTVPEYLEVRLAQVGATLGDGLPLYAHALDFLREGHGIHIVVRPIAEHEWTYDIYSPYGEEEWSVDTVWVSYYEALEAAVSAALDEIPSKEGE